VARGREVTPPAKRRSRHGGPDGPGIPRSPTTVGSGENSADPRGQHLYLDRRGGGDTFPDGTVFTEFLAKLNGASSDGVTLTGCFAGHCDWRLPTIVELQTILLAPDPCGTTPCIDPVFGPVASTGYWSATTFATFPIGAWRVYFSDGYMDADVKTNVEYVRAVRAGS
jgi:hypothetical protein